MAQKWVSDTINSGVSAAGGYAGGAVDSAGKYVSDTGRSVGEGYVCAALTSSAPTSFFLPSLLPEGKRLYHDIDSSYSDPY